MALDPVDYERLADFLSYCARSALTNAEYIDALACLYVRHSSLLPEEGEAVTERVLGDILVRDGDLMRECAWFRRTVLRRVDYPRLEARLAATGQSGSHSTDYS